MHRLESDRPYHCKWRIEEAVGNQVVGYSSQCQKQCKCPVHQRAVYMIFNTLAPFLEPSSTLVPPLVIREFTVCRACCLPGLTYAEGSSVACNDRDMYSFRMYSNANKQALNLSHVYIFFSLNSVHV